MTKAAFYRKFRLNIMAAAQPWLYRLQARHADAVALELPEYLRLMGLGAGLKKAAEKFGLGVQTIQTMLMERDTLHSSAYEFTIDGAHFKIINTPSALAYVYRTASRAL